MISANTPLERYMQALRDAALRLTGRQIDDLDGDAALNEVLTSVGPSFLEKLSEPDLAAVVTELEQIIFRGDTAAVEALFTASQVMVRASDPHIYPCSECERLKRAHTEVTDAFDAARRLLLDRIGTSTETEYESLSDRPNHAWSNASRLRSELYGKPTTIQSLFRRRPFCTYDAPRAASIGFSPRQPIL
jgi:hypothetical protein